MAVPGRKSPHPRWLKVVIWIVAILCLLVLFIFVTAALLLRSERTHSYLIQTVQAKATAALNTPVHFRDFSFHLSLFNPSVDIYQLTIEGAYPQQKTPLAQADQLHLAVTVASLLRRSWYVNDVRIEHPVIRVFVDNHGATNLPASSQPPGASGQTDLFNLGVRHFLIERGELYYNDRKSDLTADVRQLLFQSHFDGTGPRYYGTLSYRNGYVQLGNRKPLPHGLDASFSATPRQFSLENAQLSAGKSNFVLSAKMVDYVNPRIEGDYRALVDAGELRRSLPNPSLPDGVLNLKGNFSYVRQMDRPMLAVMVLKGSASSDVLTFANGDLRVAARNVKTDYSLAHGDVTVTGLRTDVLGGHLNGQLFIHDLSGATQSKLSATAHQVSLAQLQRTLAPKSASRAGIEGSVNAIASASWGKSLEDLV